MTALPRSTALAAMIAASLALSAPAFAQEAPAPDAAFAATTLNLSAVGEVEAAPDQATIQVGVQSRAATAAEAMADNAAQMNAVMGALRKLAIPERAIRTTNLNLSAQYSYPNEKPPVLQGYQATNTVIVTLDDTRKVGAVVDAATAAGANQIEGISFGLKDPSAAQDAARLAAMKTLAARAELYANASGYHVKRLINLSEGAVGVPGPIMPMAMLAKAAPTPVSPGELTVRVEVNAAYELAR
jgi:uncharacterized protein YggE